jgi:hypothetical protein
MAQGFLRCEQTRRGKCKGPVRVAPLQARPDGSSCPERSSQLWLMFGSQQTRTSWYKPQATLPSRFSSAPAFSGERPGETNCMKPQDFPPATRCAASHALKQRPLFLVEPVHTQQNAFPFRLLLPLRFVALSQSSTGCIRSTRAMSSCLATG